MSERLYLDNLELTIEAAGDVALRHAISIALLAHRSVVSFRVVNDALVLYWARPEKDDATPFLSERTSAETIVADVSEWLRTLPDDKWPPVPDVGGSVSKGWRLESRQRGWSYEFATVRPAWALHGK